MTVRLSASMKCWCTMPMPAAMASVGLRNVTGLAVDGDGALVGPLHPVEDLHQRRLAGAVLADDGVDGRRRRTAEVDVAVGDDAGEPLDDAGQLDGERRAGGVGARDRGRAVTGASGTSRPGTGRTGPGSRSVISG